jgi:hypothetical protein
MTDLIPAVLGFDVEPDLFEIPHGRPDPWTGFEQTVAVVREWRPRLERATGRPVRFSWWVRMDPQVTESYGAPGWAAEHYRAEMDELLAAGDEIGLHPHAWRWDREQTHWITDHGSPDWVRECLEVSFEAYEQAFGTPCVSHRFGSHFFSPEIVEFLRRRNVAYDLTVEPGTRRTAKVGGSPFATGTIPDQTHAPRQPYRPDPADPLRAAPVPSAAGGLWEIPLTAINPERLYAPARRVARQVRRAFQTRHRTAQLWEPGDPRTFWELVESDPLARPIPYLAFAVRTEMPLYPEFKLAFRQKLEVLEASALVRRLAFVTPAEIVREIDQPLPASEA